MASSRIVLSGVRYTFLLILLLIVLGRIEAATISARSVSSADVGAAILAAHDGDTVVVPAGTASWTSGLTITKGITLRGANVNPGDNLTVVLDNTPRGQAGNILNIKLLPTQSFRMTGFTFRYGSVTVRNPNPPIIISGTCPSIRMDHCHFDQLYGYHFAAAGWLYGVIDHCIFDARSGSSEVFLVFHSNWGGGSNGFGDGSWVEPPYFGSQKFIFIEDCVFNNLDGGQTTNGAIDSWSGGRYVCRYNIFNNTRPGNHGTETSGRLRSCRAMEIYNNKINYTITGNLGQIRGGTAVIHDNTYVGSMTPAPLVVFRTIYPTSNWGGATGGVPPGCPGTWDSNDTRSGPVNENGFSYNPTNGLYASGKHTGGNSSPTLVVSGTGWATNQWVGFELTNLDETANSSATYYNARILSNTSNTITYDHSGRTVGANTPDLIFNTGNRFEIRKPLVVLDQCGRGQGDMLAGTYPSILNKTLNSMAWPRQASEPIYAWNNTLNGKANYAPIQSGNVVIQENRDFFSNTPMPGYKPFVYPHPLTLLAPPTNLAVVPSQ